MKFSKKNRGLGFFGTVAKNETRTTGCKSKIKSFTLKHPVYITKIEGQHKNSHAGFMPHSGDNAAIHGFFRFLFYIAGTIKCHQGCNRDYCPTSIWAHPAIFLGRTALIRVVL